MNDEEDVADVIAAVQVNDFEVISDAIDKKLVTADCADADGCTFLHWAAINNRLAICCLLIDQGASVNAVGGVLQETPLAWAVRKKNYGIVQFLLTRGANINHKNIQQKGVLHIACSIGKLCSFKHDDACICHFIFACSLQALYLRFVVYMCM